MWYVYAFGPRERIARWGGLKIPHRGSAHPPLPFLPRSTGAFVFTILPKSYAGMSFLSLFGFFCSCSVTICVVVIIITNSELIATNAPSYQTVNWNGLPVAGTFLIALHLCHWLRCVGSKGGGLVTRCCGVAV